MKGILYIILALMPVVAFYAGVMAGRANRLPRKERRELSLLRGWKDSLQIRAARQSILEDPFSLEVLDAVEDLNRQINKENS